MEPLGIPHEAWFFILAYLPLHQLITISQVCKSFRDTINNDILIWLDIIVEEPLSSRLTDEILMKIASKANGRLRNLALLNCFRITDDGLMSVVHQNPLISKLYIPGCNSLTPEGILTTTKALTSSLTTLKINDIYYLNHDHLQTLKSNLPPTKRRNPRFYHKYTKSTYKTLDEETCPIDVEICPKCKTVSLIFDCPKKTCGCQGCTLCIPRCEDCGECIDCEELGGESISNFHFCLKCWLRLPKCSNCNKPYCPTLDSKGVYSSMSFQCFVCINSKEEQKPWDYFLSLYESEFESEFEY